MTPMMRTHGLEGPMPERIAYFNGEFVPESECKIHVSTRGFLRGDTVFDVARTFNGKVHQLREHLERLFRSLTYTRIDPGMTLEQMEKLSSEVFERNASLRQPWEEYGIWHAVTRGYASSLAKITQKAPSIVCIWILPLDFSAFATQYKTGAHVVFPRTRSVPSQCLDNSIKHYSRMNFSIAEMEAREIDADAYPVLLDLEGNIAENTSANFFIVTNGVIRSPRDREILQGLSRWNVLNHAERLRIPVSKEDLLAHDAYTADEAFLSNLWYCVLPVSRIDGRSIGRGVPGPITKRLMDAWSEVVEVNIVDQALQYVAMTTAATTGAAGTRPAGG
jgi:branched-chain amino acid aminotransferase